MANPVLIKPGSATLVLTPKTPIAAARGRFNMSTIMDAIAATMVSQNIAKTAYGYPIPNPTIPCAFVGYPTEVDWITISGGGGAHAKFPLFFLVGNVLEKNSRDALSLVIDGANSVKQSLEGNLGGVISSMIVDGSPDVAIETIIIGDVEYLTAKFILDVFA